MGEMGISVEVLRSPALLAFSGTKAKLYMVGGMQDDVNLERVTLVKAAQVFGWSNNVGWIDQASALSHYIFRQGIAGNAQTCGRPQGAFG